MRHISTVLSGLLVFLALCSPPTATVSHASGPPRCDHKGVWPSDVNKVRPVAIKTAAGHRLDWSTLKGCTNNNGAWVDIEIVHEPQADGTLIHGAAWCYRSRGGPWDCDYASGRAYQMQVTIGGQQRKLYTDIPAEMSVEAARQMMQQAIDVAPGLTLAQVCDYSESREKARDWEQQALEAIHRDFKFPEDPPYAQITQMSGDPFVEVGENQLYFKLATPGSDKPQFSCWGIAISV